MAEAPDIKALFEAGAHFGHKTSKWHPKMAPYIHSKKNSVHIIDLAKTVDALEEAAKFAEKVASEGKQVLLVGTKKHAQEAVREAAEATGMPYVTERWVGGMLTNRNTVDERIKYLKSQETKVASGELAAKFNKLEVQRFQEEIDEMNHIYSGIKELHARPGAVFITDIIHNRNAVKEAQKLKVPVIGIVDTNADPTSVDYPIPANDDAVKTVSLITETIKEAIEKGKAKAAKKTDADDKKGEK